MYNLICNYYLKIQIPIFADFDKKTRKPHNKYLYDFFAWRTEPQTKYDVKRMIIGKGYLHKKNQQSIFKSSRENQNKAMSFHLKKQ